LVTFEGNHPSVSPVLLAVTVTARLGELHVEINSAPGAASRGIVARWPAPAKSGAPVELGVKVIAAGR